MADLLTTIEHMRELTTYVTLLQRAQITTLLHQPASFTLFAPTESAFAQLSRDARVMLENDTAQQVAFFMHLLVPGAFVAADLMMTSSVQTLGGRSRVIDATLGLRIDNAYLIQADILADNGVLHLIDTVLLP